MSRTKSKKRCAKACCSPTKARREWGEERPRDRRAMLDVLLNLSERLERENAQLRESMHRKAKR